MMPKSKSRKPTKSEKRSSKKKKRRYPMSGRGIFMLELNKIKDSQKTA